MVRDGFHRSCAGPVRALREVAPLPRAVSVPAPALCLLALLSWLRFRHEPTRPIRLGGFSHASIVPRSCQCPCHHDGPRCVQQRSGRFRPVRTRRGRAVRSERRPNRELFRGPAQRDSRAHVGALRLWAVVVEGRFPGSESLLHVFARLHLRLEDFGRIPAPSSRPRSDPPR